MMRVSISNATFLLQLSAGVLDGCGIAQGSEDQVGDKGYSPAISATGPLCQVIPARAGIHQHKQMKYNIKFRLFFN